MVCPTTAAAFAEDTARCVLARREHLGDHVLAHFLTATAQLNPLLARLGPADWDKPHYTPVGSAPLRHIPANWLLELVVHGWDIRSRLESDAHLSEASVLVVLEVSLGRACRWRFQPGPRLPDPHPLSCGAHGRSPPEYDIVVAGDQATVEPAGTAVAHVRLRGDPEPSSCSCSDASRWLTRWRSAASWRKERGSRSPPLPSGFGGRDVEGIRVGRQAQARPQGMGAW